MRPDPRRVVIRPFLPAPAGPSDGSARAQQVIERILALSTGDAASTLAATREQFRDRHPDLDGALERNYEAVAGFVKEPGRLGPEQRLLIGAYFTQEYSVEAAALSNPSIVPAPDQSGLAAGELRFIVSLRAIGEGHLSSIEFRSGIIDANGNVSVDEPSRFTTAGSITRSVAPSDYTIEFAPDSGLSERVIFPSGPTERQGMEDARFVRFRHEGGEQVYYAVYTAFDGRQIAPQLIETSDFRTFDVATLSGDASRNKGMAIFPRKVGGRFAALSRQDNQSNYVMFSEDVRRWQDPHLIQRPERPWELVQLGNCGSPIETEAGWLVITHGVGPMRRYALGAILLDLEDPRRVIGHLDEPLLVPTEDERDGYVPNVVYSCGSLVHLRDLVIPYGFSDLGSGIAAIPLQDVLGRLT
jgi:predicted GH43/DUF377 family glycosyl hydrolase